MATPDISLIAAPDEVVVSGLREAVIDACDEQKDRFAITSANAGNGRHHEPLSASRQLVRRVLLPVDSRRSAARRRRPPARSSSGSPRGVYARVDLAHGVHTPPANEIVHGIVTEDPLEFTIGKHEQDILNPRGVNVIRDVRSGGKGVRAWGARTMASDTDWKYINVRRLLIFIEQSIVRGLEWTVFEHNADATWTAVRTLIDDFLTTVWRTGALMGTRRRGILRHVRPHHDDAGRHRQRPTGLRGRRGSGEAGRVRRHPPEAEDA
jgi:hypothetical protein